MASPWPRGGRRQRRPAPSLRPEWFPDWSGDTAVLVASGPSAKGTDLTAARDKARVLTINNSWQLAPWADALYACDAAWWWANGEIPEFKGLKITQDPAVKFARRVHCEANANDLIFDRPGVIAAGRNSGFQALNLAVQFGAKRIILVGYDMTLANGVHWHGRHEGTLNNPSERNVYQWRQILDSNAPSLSARGIEVLNASAVSTLTAFPKVRLAEAL